MGRAGNGRRKRIHDALLTAFQLSATLYGLNQPTAGNRTQGIEGFLSVDRGRSLKAGQRRIHQRESITTPAH
jgi:hypothetical protein